MQKWKQTATALLFAIVFCGAVWLGGTQVAANDDIRVQLAGRFVDFEGQQPVILQDRTMVPVRGVFTVMGFTPSWDAATYTATLSNATTTIVIPIGQPTFTVNGQVIVPDVPAQNIEGRVLIPLRAVVEAIDGTAYWAVAERIAFIMPPPDLMQVAITNVAGAPITARTHNVTFRANGGSGTMPAQVFHAGLPQNLNANAFTRNGYDFLGWSQTAAGEVEFADAASFLVVGNRDLYAVWQPAPPVITTESLPEGTTRHAYSHTLAATTAASAAPVTWSISAGSLPDGLQLDTATGAIAGRPTVVGMFEFTVAAQNTIGTTTAEMYIDVVQNRWSSIDLPNRRLTDTERAEWIADYFALGGATEFELEVIRLINIERANYNLVALQLNHTQMLATRFYAQTMLNLNLPLGHHEGPYGGSAGTIAAFGGAWNAANGTSSGSSPQAAVTSWMNSPGHRANILNANLRFIGIGAYHNGQATRVYMLASINNAGTHQPPVAGQATTHTVAFRANGGTGTMANQTFQQGTEQALRANAFVRTGHVFAGWATTATGAVVYTNEQVLNLTANRTLYAVWQSATATPAITTTTLPNAAFNIAYSHTLAATGATPITWSITTGDLPAGLTLNATTGAITGTPTAAGTFTFTVRAQNAAGNVTAQLQLLVTQTNATVPSVVGMTREVAISTLVSAGFAAANITVTEVNDVATVGNVVSQNPAQGTILGASAAITIYVSSGVNINITPTTLPNAAYGQSYTQQLVVSGLTGTVTWAMANEQGQRLPNGMTMSSAGVVSGTPTEVGTFNFRVYATSAAGRSAYTQITIVVEPFTVAFGNINNNTTVGEAVTFAVATSVTVTSATFTVTENAVTSSPQTITGNAFTHTFTEVGVATITVVATSATGQTVTASITVTVSE